MQLSVKEVDGKLRVVVIDDNGVIHAVDNISDGGLSVSHIGMCHWAASVQFFFVQ